MSSFTNELDVRHINGEDWMVLRKFTYHVTSKKSDEKIHIPRGYMTDFASIPRVFWPIVGHPAAEYGKAAVVHDYLYETHRHSRKRSDKIFYEAMVVSKVAKWKRKIIYYAVRMGGRWAWKKGGKSE